MTEADATKKIMDKVYAARKQIYEETKYLSSEEYIAYFGNQVQNIIKRSGYRTVRSEDGLGYILHKC